MNFRRDLPMQTARAEAATAVRHAGTERCTSAEIVWQKSFGRISFNRVGNAPRLAAKRGPMGTRLNEGTSAHWCLARRSRKSEVRISKSQRTTAEKMRAKCAVVGKKESNSGSWTSETETVPDSGFRRQTHLLRTRRDCS